MELLNVHYLIIHLHIHDPIYIIFLSHAKYFTDVTDEDDFGVGRNVLGEEGPLVLR